ncbi:MAG: thymidine kinase [bacterium]|nr:thymidine kinase [bacterium]
MSRLEVIAGPMFSGKSEEMIRRLVRSSFARKGIFTLRPRLDDRVTRNIFNLINENNFLNSYKNIRSGFLDNPETLKRAIKDFGLQVLAIDEAQFFEPWIVDIIKETLDRFARDDFRIIVSGLDMNFLKEPFGPMPALMAMADEVVKLTAICHRCRTNPANLTYKLGDSKQKVEVGDSELYQARCRHCHALPD